MSNLTIIRFDGKYVAHSKDVAEMIGKQHKDLLETIRGYIEHLTSGDFRSSDFFMSYEYADAKGELRPCYWLTRKGCDMVANKMTGEKGVLFTAAYVTKFEEMEGQQTKFQVPQNMGQALRLAADLWEENQKMLPKANYFDNLVDRNLLTNFRDTAKELHTKEGLFIDWLLDNEYIYRDQNKKLKPYAKYVPSLFELKEWGNDKKAGTQTLITPRGRETFRLLLGREVARV